MRPRLFRPLAWSTLFHSSPSRFGQNAKTITGLFVASYNILFHTDYKSYQWWIGGGILWRIYRYLSRPYYKYNIYIQPNPSTFGQCLNFWKIVLVNAPRVSVSTSKEKSS
jgi:hypothetical protein